MPACLICRTPYEPFLSFGKMPIANGFLLPEAFNEEYFFELRIGFCPECHMAQLTEQPDREKMFHENYAFHSSTSAHMALHFRTFAEFVLSTYARSSDAMVYEIGSNDGIMLQNFATAGVHHLGIEPSENVARIAMAKGIRTIVSFFDEALARELAAEHGRADAFLGANVMCHIPYLHSVASGIKILLKPEGVLIFEDPYLGDILEKTSYDQIYDEHVFYFSLSSVSRLFEQHDMEVIDVMPQSVHGGSMRYVIANKGARDVSSAVARQREKEKKLGLDRPETYGQLSGRIRRSREELLQLLRDLRKQGKRVVGYGATSKSTTVLNYCGIDADLVEFISDTTPAKQGKFSPGAHIPVRPYEAFKQSYPDYALLFAWNHAAEIMSKEQDFRKAGGKWVVYVPRVGVL